VAAVGRARPVSPLAHAGHWLVDLIYVAPLALLGVVAIVAKVRARRRERQGGNHLAS
jgi:hypothetical protein